MFELVILILILQLLFSFFGQSIFPHIPHSGGFIYLLSLVIFSLIAAKFLLLMLPVL
jgi:hypothetical protein